MDIIIEKSSLERKGQVSAPACPYCNGPANICKASLFGLSLSQQKKEGCCNSEDYYNCPLFLARALRRR